MDNPVRVLCAIVFSGSVVLTSPHPTPTNTVMDAIDVKGFIPENLIENETKWFYEQLSIDDSFFATESIDNIVSYIHTLYSAKVAAYARDDKKLEIQLVREDDAHAFYIDTSSPGTANLEGPQYETRIDEKYLSSNEGKFRVETFRATNDSIPGDGALRCYFVYKCDFIDPTPAEGETDLAKISDKGFYGKATEYTRAIYSEIVSQVVQREGPVIEMYEIDGSRERRVIIGYKQDTTPGYFSALSDLYHFYGLTSTRKYVEQFSNGVTIISMYLAPAFPQTANTADEIKAMKRYPPIENSIHQIVKEASLLFCLPNNAFKAHFARGDMSLQESIYAHCAFIFVQHFLNRLGSEYTTLQQMLGTNKEHTEILEKLKRRLRQETFTRDYLFELINNNLDVVKQMYLQFADVHYIQSKSEGDSFLPTLSYQRLQTQSVLSAEELRALIRKNAANDHEVMVMEAFLTFNTHVLKTNFYTPTKVALSFRLSPDFLPESEYPQPLYGMFLVVGQEFRGFHLRFADISRGGIRIVKSRNREAYSINARSMFDENYNLANTQQRKNKDIPEGGSKGVILLNNEHQDKATIAFHKYIDSLIDLLLKGDTPGIKEPIVDLHGSQEILFMGPDENTAGLVNWATMHAKKRGAPWWKSFFTGKSPALGGIPHDEYGMTSLSVREYVKGIYRKLEIEQGTVRKQQTGGPDGDLGSNEILLSGEKYTTIIDGAGVLYDPNGLDREELLSLAKRRVMISEYDASKISKDGYRVLVDDKDVTLPSGEVVSNGTQFRNTYHLRCESVDMFVPCGGRPEAIDINNVGQLFVDGKPKIKYLVEGANLFITQQAKLRLEEAGVIVYKDASANKGGVTSSSLEVLASLAFDDENFAKDMCIRDGVVPEFYKAYVKEVQSIIQTNARLEFEAIWREHEVTGKPRSVLSDELSIAINDLSAELKNSTLWDNVEFRNSTLHEALPQLLVEEIGLSTILERVPESYLKAIFGSYLAGRFVYKMGASPGQFAFFEYMSEKTKKN